MQSTKQYDDLAKRINTAPKDLSPESLTAWARERADNLTMVYKSADSLMPLLYVGLCDAEYAGVKVVKRGNYHIRPTRIASYYYHEAGQSRMVNGRWKTIIRAVNDTYVRAFAAVRNIRTADIAYGKSTFQLIAPEGYCFSVDSNGFFIALRDDLGANYHPTARECYAAQSDNFAEMIKWIDTLSTQRKKLETEAAQEKQTYDGVYVSVADSYAAGNCTAGTLRFCERRNLDAAKHYPASDFLALAQREPRLKIALRAAKLRHEKEMQAGYCNLHFGHS